MRLKIYIFLIFHILNVSSVFAEKVNEASFEANSVKWEKLEEDKFKSLKKIVLYQLNVTKLIINIY